MIGKLFLLVIPGRAKREPGIQRRARRLHLDSGSPLRGVRNDDGEAAG
jgi:hypothetical protein